MPGFAGPPLRERDMWGLTPFDQAGCRIAFRRMRYERTLTPPGLDRPALIYPGYGGGINWGGAAVTEEFFPGFRNSVASYTVSLLTPRVIADLRLAEPGLRVVARPSAKFLPLTHGRAFRLRSDKSHGG